MYQIEISKDLDFYNKYLFVPVMVTDAPQIVFEEVIDLEPVISIGQPYVECFLSYFLKKYFDPSLEENKRRITCWRNGVYACNFEEQGGYNFYDYTALKHMASELLSVADLLEEEYENPILFPIIENFNIHFVHNLDSDVWIAENFGDMEDHIDVVCSFYRRFAHELVSMMEQNPNAHLLNIEYGY